jgi:toxin ParE1/3/4
MLVRLSVYPRLLFYVEGDDHVGIWRVLHGSPDIPLWMQPPE